MPQDLPTKIPPSLALHPNQEVSVQTLNKKENNMLNWAITFLVIALIAAVLGFTGIAGTAVGFAKILFLIFLVLFIISFIMGRRAPRL